MNFILNVARGVLILSVIGLVGTGCTAPAKRGHAAEKSLQGDWRAQLHQQLPLLGHRNWIVIADSAYPLQSRAGITTIYTGADQVDVVAEVLKAVGASGHVSPLVSMDQELVRVTEEDAPGVNDYRNRMKAVLAGKLVKTSPHIEIIKDLDETAKLFNVLVLKTDLKVPYTSVFIQLDCAYWNGDKEKRLREKE
jgi:L-fucose mutarotase/ribose pyranase (RbsD/FucU family)